MPAPNDPRQPASTLYAWGVCGLLLVMVALVYWQTAGFDFLTIDDAMFIVDSPQVRAGLTRDSIAWAFTSGPLGEWYPLSMMSHMLDCQLFGLNAAGHHLTGVLLHAATAVGLFLVLRSMTGELWPSAAAATVFAVHPQHVESVAWIAERRDVLSGLFFVLTLAAYLGYVRHGRGPGRYLLVAWCLALGLMSKSMLVTVPPLLLLLDYWPLGRFGRAADLPQHAAALPEQRFWQLVFEKLPLVALALADCAMTLWTHADSSGLTLPPWGVRMANAAVSLVTYLGQFFWPANLAAFYPYPADGCPVWKVAVAVLVLLAVTAGATAWRRRYPFLAVGWYWFLGMMVPVLGLVYVSDHAMADRYMYLPSIGLSIAVIWGTARLSASLEASRFLVGTAAALATGLLASQAVRQTSYWHDDVGLWEHSLAVTGENSKAEDALGLAFAKLGRLDEAVQHYVRAARWGANAGQLNNLALAVAGQGKLDEAVAFLEKALELKPRYALTRANLGFVRDKQGQPEEAIRQYRRAIELDPALVLAQFNLADLLRRQGKTDEALVHFQQAITLDPTFAGGYLGLATALAERGETEQALANCRKALELAPDDPGAQRLLDQLLDAGKQAPPP